MKRALAAALLFSVAVTGCKKPARQAEKTEWHVLTSLPLFLGEGSIDDVLNGESTQSLLIKSLGEKRRMMPLDTLGDRQLNSVKRLFAVQPARLPPEELVALDDWVRAGGQAIIFADPDMVWPLSYPPGDPRLPPASTLLDPLFTHWGLALEGKRAPPARVVAQIDGVDVTLVNPGRWRTKSSDCRVSDQQLLATCALGKGRVILLADADVADPRLWEESGKSNLPLIERLFERIETK